MARQGKKSPPTHKAHKPAPQIIELNIVDIASEGHGIALHRTQQVLVPFTIPGERVRVRLGQGKGRFIQAEGLTLLESSADRVRPRCQHFGKDGCANCQWQHMNYEAQLALKTDILIEHLERLAGLDSDHIGLQPAIGCPQLWGYRTQIDFLPTTEGTLGFWSGDLGQTIPISECHILREDLWALVSELNLEVENLTNMRVQVGDPGSAMVILRTADESIPELESTLPISINFLLNDNVPINLVGQTHIHQTLAGRPFRVTAGTQFRHYPAQIERLIEVVLGDLDLQGFETALDVYGGVGIFSAFMAAHTSYITYIDSYPPAATDAEENLAEFDHIDILEGSAEDVLATLADEGEGVDVAVLDPPRTGLSDEVMEALDWLGIPRLVYVSQDATSLAQNAKTLVEKYEYRLIKLQPIDFDPQSYRVHSVCLFEKSM